MQNFLEICQEVLSETGISGTGPTSVVGTVGIEKKIVGWVQKAWLDVQQYRNDWPWMLKEFSFTTSPSKDIYLLTELSLTDVERWELAGATIYKTAEGKAGERYLGSIDYRVWWENLRIGTQTPAPPDKIMFTPGDNDLRVYPLPDAEYTITLRYFRALQRLTADADIPLMPTNQAWQDIIKWKALKYYGFYDGAPDIAAEAQEQWDSAIQAIDNRYGAVISMNMGTLA